ncbi:uncharacterized protein CC84DRAFT_569267 [Paraphaeosphaeria sporulosa]|uniref:Uncharacterized protein n=1 Tax=Paraphaeosphaeria sporulosa TaxID=1460663 RepID=A0A177CMV9_9PLEO|nr:uncharacterized protein CC84DRAFT_569267 [Paraphaeosphaeria sporulosa]OAG08292.1 hypothetical protein CC84DRAFT_569267 [Paraphaeosphaeria sporulosa]
MISWRGSPTSKGCEGPLGRTVGEAMERAVVTAAVAGEGMRSVELRSTDQLGQKRRVERLVDCASSTKGRKVGQQRHLGRPAVAVVQGQDAINERSRSGGCTARQVARGSGNGQRDKEKGSRVFLERGMRLLVSRRTLARCRLRPRANHSVPSGAARASQPAVRTHPQRRLMSCLCKRAAHQRVESQPILPVTRTCCVTGEIASS